MSDKLIPLKLLGYQLLDDLVASKGNDFIRDILVERLAEGDNPADISKEEFGVPYVVLRGWIELNCPDAIALAGRARADVLEWKATNLVENAEPEEVSLVRMQSEHYMKIASKLDRVKWGDKSDGGMSSAGGTNFTIVIGDARPELNVIESNG